MPVTYPITCPISGTTLGEATFGAPLSEAQLAYFNTAHVTQGVGQLLAQAGINIDQAIAAGMNLAALQLAATRATVQANLDAWLAQQYATPIEVNGILLPLDLASQDSLTRLFVADSGLVQMGAAQETDSTGLADASGVWQTMTYANFFAMVPAYVSACKAIAQNYATAKKAIGDATDIATLNSITWG